MRQGTVHPKFLSLRTFWPSFCGLLEKIHCWGRSSYVRHPLDENLTVGWKNWRKNILPYTSYVLPHKLASWSSHCRLMPLKRCFHTCPERFYSGSTQFSSARGSSSADAGSQTRTNLLCPKSPAGASPIEKLRPNQGGYKMKCDEQYQSYLIIVYHSVRVRCAL